MYVICVLKLLKSWTQNYFPWISLFIKFIHSEKATQLCEIFTLLLSYVVPVKSKVKISQNFVAFSEYMNFIFDSFRINRVHCTPHDFTHFPIQNFEFPWMRMKRILLFSCFFVIIIWMAFEIFKKSRIQLEMWNS